MAKRSDRKLFDTYAQNLNLVLRAGGVPLTLESPTYICPLCKEAFPEEIAFPKNGESLLSVEHVPPKSVGGKPVILTCKKCNHTHGAKTDSQLKKGIDLRTFLAKQFPGSIDAQFEVGDGITANGTISINDKNKVYITIDEKRVNPKHKELIFKALAEAGTIPGKIDVKLNLEYNKRLSSLSLLKAAYLLLFQKFGYAFIFTPSAETIRKVLYDVDQKYTFPFVIQSTFPDVALGINIIVKPAEMRSYLVVMDLSGTHRVGIVIPGAHDADCKVYDWMSEHKKFTYECIKSDEDDYLLDENKCLKAVTNW